MNPCDIKSYDAEAAIAANRIVKFGAADYGVVQAAAATDAMVGVAVSPNGAAAAGDRVDVAHDGIADVKLGGTVTAGAAITANASGQGVAAAPSAGANVRIVGFALTGGASGDIVPVKLSLGSLQG